jgi:hypothetical protein
MLKIIGKIMKKITDSGVVTITINDFIFKMVFVVPQLVFNIRELGIKLVFFIVFCFVKIGVRRLFCHFLVLKAKRALKPVSKKKV